LKEPKNTNNAKIENYKGQPAQIQNAYDKWEISNENRKKRINFFNIWIK